MAAPPVPPSRIDEYLAGMVDPFPANQTLLDQYVPDANLAPVDCLARTDSTGYIPCFLATIESQPEIITMPFVSSLPGLPPVKHALRGNVIDGQLPDLVELDSEPFRLTANHHVATTATFTQAWTDNPGTDLLPPVAATAANHELVRCRRVVPIPHEFAATMLLAHDTHSLTWRWIWLTIISGSVLGNAAKEAAYVTFTNYIRVASTATAPAVVGDPNEGPPTTHVYTYGPIAAGVRNRALQKLRSFLPGLGAPGPLNAQLMHTHIPSVTIGEHTGTVLSLYCYKHAGVL